jgi:ectoine hydroxylase-related dioxygenase (phytanoyl-CoA dioxygenase family)
LRFPALCLVHPDLPDGILAALRESASNVLGPGQRCLLDHPIVRQAAALLRSELVKAGFLSKSAVAIQAIAFDKTPATNWRATWHQDVMFPFAKRVTSPGYELASVKDDVNYARPPRAILEAMLVVRLHLDDCSDPNGPLRVAPGSRREGVVKSTDLPATVKRCGYVLCLAKTGEALLMKPLLLHASSPATSPRHRRVLHFVYYVGRPITDQWHRSV